MQQRRAPRFTPAAVPQATQAAIEAQTNEDTYTPPHLIKNSPGVTKVSVLWEQTGAHGITASYNMTSVTDGGGSGDTDHLWNVDFGSANYSIFGGTDAQGPISTTGATRLAGGVTTVTYDESGVAVDRTHNSLSCLGEQ